MYIACCLITEFISLKVCLMDVLEILNLSSIISFKKMCVVGLQ